MESILEEWRDVVGYDGLYQVSNLGNVRSLKYGKVSFRKCHKDKDGYSCIGLCKNGKMKNCKVHRLVWEAFNSPVPSGMQLDHINTVRDDNRIENLRVVSPRENNRNPITAERKREASRRLAEDPQWRQKTQEANRRKAKDPQWLNSVRETNRRKAKDSQWRNRQRDGVRMVRAKPVIQLDVKTGEIIRHWDCIADAGRELELNDSNISACCYGKRKGAGGYRWKFA